MTMLTHEEARRYMQAAADKRLSAQERKALEAHLAECPECRAYSVEIESLQFTITRALRARWDRRRAPVNLVKRAQVRARQYNNRKQVFRFANLMAQVSSFVVLAALVMNVVQTQRFDVNRETTPTSAAQPPVTRMERSVPDFELASGNEITFLASDSTDNGDYPVTLNSRMLPQ